MNLRKMLDRLVYKAKDTLGFVPDPYKKEEELEVDESSPTQPAPTSGSNNLNTYLGRLRQYRKDVSQVPDNAIFYGAVAIRAADGVRIERRTVHAKNEMVRLLDEALEGKVELVL